MSALHVQNAIDHMQKQDAQINDLRLCIANLEAHRQRLLARCNSLEKELSTLAPRDFKLVLPGQDELTLISQDVQLVAIEKMQSQHPELYEAIVTQVYLAWYEDEMRHQAALAAEDRASDD